VVHPRWNGEKVLLQHELLPAPGVRLAARLIDQIIVLLLASTLLVPAYVFELDWLIAPGIIVFFAGAGLYDAVCLSRWGQTLGKKYEGLRVVTLANGFPPGFMQALLRWVILTAWPLAEYSVLLSKSHRGTHDRLAGTVVVYSVTAPPLR